jgi:hypothetical protein
MLVMNSVSCDLSRFKRGDAVADIISKFSAKKAENQANNEEETMKSSEIIDQIKNLLGMTTEEAPQEPEVQNAEDEKVIAERERITALDALDDHTNEAVTKMVDTAKENGMTAEQIKPFVDAVVEDSTKKAAQTDVLDAIRALIKDEMNSGAEEIAPSVPVNEEDDKQSAINRIVDLANKK